MISITHSPSTSGLRASISTNKPAGYLRWGSAIHQLSQPPATAGKARSDRPGPDAEAGGNGLVPLPFQPNQQHHRSLSFGQPCQSTLEVAQFEPFDLMGETGERRLGVGTLDHGPVTHRSAHAADIQVVQDGEQPRSQVCPLPPKVDVFDPAKDRLLNEIIRARGIVRQMQRITPEAWQQRRNLQGKAVDRGFVLLALSVALKSRRECHLCVSWHFCSPAAQKTWAGSAAL